MSVPMRRDMVLWFAAPYSAGPDKDLAGVLSRDFMIRHVRLVSAITSELMTIPPAVVFFDLDCPSREELKWLSQVKETYPSIPVFLFTSLPSEDLAVWAFRTGVRDYFVKPVNAARVAEKVKACMGLLRRQRDECRFVASTAQPIPVPMVDSNCPDERNLQIVYQYIEKNYRRKITLDEAAGLILMSAFQLCRLFRKKTGLAFKEYLIRYRLQRAETLLAGTSASITEIACAVGFADISNFQRLFRKRNGVTPREYRKNSGILIPPQKPERPTKQRIIIGPR